MIKKLYRTTDSITIEIGLDEVTKSLKQVHVLEINQEAFPPLAVYDKMKMSGFVHALVTKILQVLSDDSFFEGR